MKTSKLVFALLSLISATVRADTLVTITPTGAAAATVANRWAIGSNISGLGYIDGNSGFPGATATNLFSITGAPIGGLGDPVGFVSYLPTGAATPQPSVGNAMTPDRYSGLTYVAENLGLIGPLSFYAIHHRTTGDYLALIQPSVPTISDQKPMSAPGTAATPGATGYFGLSYAADNPGGWGAQLFYYLRTNALGETIFGSMPPALLSGPTDRWNLGPARGFTDLAYTSVNLGFGHGPSQFYYLRLDPITQTTFFGHLNPLTGVATDIQNLGGVYRTLVFTPTNLGYGANLFYSIGRAAQTLTFAPLSNHTACDSAFTFTAPTSSAGLPVALAISGPATLSGNTITLTGATGTVTVTASQAGNATYAPAISVAQSFTVTACAPAATAQTITFAPLSDRGLCDGAFTATATSSSGLPVTLSVVSGPATVSGNTVTLTGAGTVTLAANQAGNATYAAAPSVTRTFAAAKCAATVTLTNLSNTYYDHEYNALEWIVATTVPAGLPVIITHEGSTSIPAAVRSYNVVATINHPLYAGSTTGVLVITGDPRVAQTVTFGVATLPNRVFGDAPFTLNPSSSSGMPTQIVVVSGPATISGNTVTPTGAGVVVLRVSQAGHILTHMYAELTQSFVVSKATATVTLAGLAHTFDGSAKTATASTNPTGLPVVLTYDGLAAPPSAVGTYAVQAVVNSPNHQGSAAATLAIVPIVVAPVAVVVPVVVPPAFVPPVNVPVFTPTLQGQTITISPIGSVVVGQPATLSASSNVGLPVVFSIVSGNAVINGNVLTATATGPIVLRATQAGNGTYAAAFAQAIVVVAAGNTVTFDAPAGPVIINTPIQLTASSTNGQPVTFTVISGNATVNGSTLTPTGMGPIVVRATVGNTSTDLIFASPQRAPQSMTFAAMPDLTTASPGTVLPQFSSAGLPITYTVTGPATVVGNVLTLTGGAGLVTVNATQAGNDLHLAAATVTRTFAVTVARRTDRLVNLSSRMRIVAGDDARSLIAGFVISGDVAKRVLVRAVGPGLRGFAVTDALANPRLQLYQGSRLVAENDDWINNVDVTTTGGTVGAFMLAPNSADSALVTTLAPGAYTAIVTGVSGSGIALVEVYDADTVSPLSSHELSNLSARGFVDVGEGALMAGFVVAGTVPKRMLVRGIGPSLTQFGVTNALADPRLDVFSNGVLMATNDNWETGTGTAGLSAAFASAGAFALASGTRDAALIVTLPPGNYTVQVSGVGATTGVGLVELYQLP